MKKTLIIIPIIVLVSIIILLSLITLNSNKNINTYKSKIKEYKSEITKVNHEINELKKKMENIPQKNLSSIQKSCEYTDTFEFDDYYNKTYDINSNYYEIILYQNLGKSGTIIKTLNKENFEQNFIKNHSYEITFKKTIIYDEETKEFKENSIITKIEPTDKKGLEQTHELCILE